MRGGLLVVMETVCCFSECENEKTHLRSDLLQETSRHLTVRHHREVDMASQRDVIDFRAMEAELRTAVESDRKHRRENEAKLRAVTQGVSYEQFRGLVLTCHLRPLDHSDKHGAPRKQPWNPVAPSNQ